MQMSSNVFLLFWFELFSVFFFFPYSGFNDAVNGFNDDGWSIMHCNGAEDIIVAVNSTKHLNNISDPLSFLGGVLCAKASMLLQVSAYTVFLKSSLLRLWKVFWNT